MKVNDFKFPVSSKELDKRELDFYNVSVFMPLKAVKRGKQREDNQLIVLFFTHNQY